MIPSTLKRGAYAGQLSLPSRENKTRATAEARSKKQRLYKPLPTQFRARADFIEVLQASHRDVHVTL
jgi:hypothetical protein